MNEFPMYLDAAIVVYNRKLETDLEIVQYPFQFGALNSPSENFIEQFQLPIISQVKTASDVTTDFVLAQCGQNARYEIVNAQFLLCMTNYYLKQTLYNIDLTELTNAVTKAVANGKAGGLRWLIYPHNFIKRIETDIMNLKTVTKYQSLQWNYR